MEDLKRVTKYNLIAFLFLFSVVHFQSSAQTDLEKTLEKARNSFNEGDYNSAVGYYKILLKSDSGNIEYHYELAQTYYFSDSLKLRAIPYFEYVLQNSSDSLVELYYYLGKVYQLDYRLEDAINCYKKYLRLFKPEKSIALKNVFTFKKPFFSGTDQEGDYFIKEVKRNIEECKSARDRMERPLRKMELNGKKKEYEIENLGEKINSKYDDYGAVISPGDSLLFFTSRRKAGRNDKVDPEDGKYNEDIYVSKLGEDGWSEAMPVGPPINTKKNESMDFLSVDGKTLYFCRGTKNGTFYFSNRIGPKWSDPKKFENSGEINSNEWETSLSYSVSDNTLYVVSDKAGGYGGRDIYKSVKMPSGKWGPLENLGPLINTEFDEEAPFVSPDGKYLYFASRGHNSIGGFDIYKSERQNGVWVDPQNMGYPINTTGNDMYFTLDNGNDKAYYSSSRGDQEKQNADMDIYSITLCDDIQETVIKGLVTIAEGTPKDLFISVMDKNTQSKVAHCVVDKSGKYEITLLRNVDYIFSFEGKGIVYFSTEITLPKQCKAYDLFQKVEISKRVDMEHRQWIQKACIKNAFFDIRQKVLLSGKNKSADEYENYLAYLNGINSKTTHLNYKEVIVENCLSDIYDLADLKLHFVDSLHNQVRTASLDKNGIFVFNELNYTKPGLFKLEGGDPEVEYNVKVAIGADTVQLVRVKDGFVFPETKLNFYNPSGVLVESVFLNVSGKFVFHKHDMVQPGEFKLEKGDVNTAYPVVLTRRGSERVTMQLKGGVLFPYKKLSFNDTKDSVIETSLLSKDSVFTFYKIAPDAPGNFKLREEGFDSATYEIKIVYQGNPEKTMQFSRGIIFPKRYMSFYSDQNEIVETALMARDGAFVFKKITEKQAGVFKMRGAESDSVYSVNLVIDGVRKAAIRTKNGFVFAERFAAAQLDSLSKMNSIQNAMGKDSILAEQKADEQKKQTALTSLITGNTVKFQKQLIERKEEEKRTSPDTLLPLPVRKLYLYSLEGTVLETARSNGKGVFVFKKLSPDAFGLFRLEGEETETILNYKIQLFKGDSVLSTLQLSDMQSEDGFLFQKKKLNFYAKSGELIETSLVNKQGDFVFHKLGPDEGGTFKLVAAGQDSGIYNIDIVKGTAVLDARRFQNGTVFPRKVLRAYNKEGVLVEVAFAERDGCFTFHKLIPEEFNLFKFEQEDDAKLNYKIRFASLNGTPKVLERKDLQVEKGFAFVKKQLIFYDEKGRVRETALLNKKGDFVFHKLGLAEKGLFKMETSDLDNTSYPIELVSDKDTIINKQFKNGKVTSLETLYAYTANGEVVEFAIADKNGTFVFHKLLSDQLNVFKLEGEPDTKLEYEIQILKEGSVEQKMKLKDMQAADGYLFQIRRLNCYDKQGNVLETATGTRNGKFIFHKIIPDQVCCFKSEDGNADHDLHQISVVRGTDTIQNLNFKDGVVFPRKALRFYNMNGMPEETAMLNADGIFQFHKLPYDERGSFKFENGESPDTTNNYLIEIIKDGFTMRSMKLKEMNYERGVFITRKRLSGYDKDGILVEVALLNKEGNFVFRKLPPDQFCFFRLEGEDVSSIADYKISMEAGNSIKERKLKEMRNEDGAIFEDRKLSFYTSEGTISETSRITKNGTFHFYKLKAEEPGYFLMNEEDQDAKLYEIKIHKGKETKVMEYQNGLAFDKDILARVDKMGSPLTNDRILINTKYSALKTELMQELLSTANDIAITGLRKELAVINKNYNEEINNLLKTTVTIAENKSLHRDTALDSGVDSFSKILFDFDKYKINDDYKGELQEIVAYLKNCMNCSIELSGFSDAKGSANHNLRLSARRVNAVANSLIEEGIAKKRITTRPRGSSHPAAPNKNSDGSDNPEGRKQNRRVELRIVKN